MLLPISSVHEASSSMQVPVLVQAVDGSPEVACAPNLINVVLKSSLASLEYQTDCDASQFYS